MCEAMVFDTKGNALHAFTGGTTQGTMGSGNEQETRRVEHVIPKEAVKSGRYECFIEVSCNGMFGTANMQYKYQPPAVSLDSDPHWLTTDGPHIQA